VRTMTEPRDRYSSYLLRLWKTASDDERVCRASLESAHSGERVGFASLDALMSFLRRECKAAPGREQGAGGSGEKR
jgi:hypothetical protein